MEKHGAFMAYFPLSQDSRLLADVEILLLADVEILMEDLDASVSNKIEDERLDEGYLAEFPTFIHNKPTLEPVEEGLDMPGQKQTKIFFQRHLINIGHPV